VLVICSPVVPPPPPPRCAMLVSAKFATSCKEMPLESYAVEQAFMYGTDASSKGKILNINFRYLSWYSDSLPAEGPGFNYRQGQDIFPFYITFRLLQGPTCLLSNWYLDSFSWGKAAGTRRCPLKFSQCRRQE
jgi:hypothetical protein